MTNPLYDELRPLLDSPSADPVRERPVQNGRRIWAFCPCHPDGTKYGKRSLSLDQRYGLECFAGCEFKDVVRAIRERAGIYPTRPAPTRSMPRKRGVRGALDDVIASWVYTNAEGATAFRVQRTSGKEFPQFHPAGSCANHADDPNPCKPADPGWRWGRGGAEYYLFRLPELLAAPIGETIFLPEGEGCVDAIVALGLVATTSPEGAGKWRDEYAESLRGRSVCVLPDNDRPGADHAKDAVRSLLGVATEIKSVVLPGLLFKGDIRDWLGAGGSREQLLALVARAPVIHAPSAAFPKAVDVRVLSLTGERA